MNRREFFGRSGAFVAAAAFCGVTQLPKPSKTEYDRNRCTCVEQIRAGVLEASGGMCGFCWDAMQRNVAPSSTGPPESDWVQKTQVLIRDDWRERCICKELAGTSGGICVYCLHKGKFILEHSYVPVTPPETVSILGHNHTVQEVAEALSAPLT